eukprot:11123690-Prorocentrum_lima.AAC.1
MWWKVVVVVVVVVMVVVVAGGGRGGPTARLKVCAMQGIVVQDTKNGQAEANCNTSTTYQGSNDSNLHSQ